ncbi:MAG: hypothetical protein IJP66_08025 [Kiritimatiellae bacterium]|nr:hypothetical protein [Kiritimatiellia bacterium]
MRRVVPKSAVAAALFAAGIAAPANAADGQDWTRAGWTLPASGASRGGDILTFDLAETGTAMATAPIDLSPYAGKCATARIRVAAENLLPGPRRHLGYKFMISFADEASGEMMWPGAPCLVGTFDWRESTIELDLRGRRPGPATLHLGIQDSSGRVSFDLSSIEIAEAEPLFPDDNSVTKCRYSPEVLARPVGRGVMLPSGPCREDDFRTLREWAGWSVEHEGTCHADLHPSADNPRKRALLEGLRRE